MATKKYGYNQYKPDGPAGMDIVDQELNRYSPAFDYLSGFVTRSKLKQVDDDRTGTPGTPNTQPNTPNTQPNTPNTQPNTRFSSEFATEADAKNYISTFYKDKLGRDAKFGTTTDDTDASYWLKHLKSGKEDKASISSNILLNKEYTNPTSDTGGFLQDYSKKIADTSKQTESISTGVTKDASGNYDTANLTADQKTKFDKMSAGVKDTYAQTLDVADLSKTTTQTSDHIDSGAAKTSTIDQAIKDAYKLLGRQPDKSGYEYWAKELTKNPTFDLSKSFKLSKEYKDNNP